MNKKKLQFFRKITRSFSQSDEPTKSKKGRQLGNSTLICVRLT